MFVKLPIIPKPGLTPHERMVWKLLIHPVLDPILGKELWSSKLTLNISSVNLSLHS